MAHDDMRSGKPAGQKPGTNFKQGMEQVEHAMNKDKDEMQNRAQDAARAGADTMRRGAEEGLRSGQEALRSGAEGFTKAFDLSRDMGRDVGRDMSRIAERTSRNVETLSKASSVLMQGLQEVSREFMGMTQDNLRRSSDALSQISQVRTIPDMLNAQADLMRESLQRAVETARRIGEISVRTASETSETIREIADQQQGEQQGEQRQGNRDAA